MNQYSLADLAKQFDCQLLGNGDTLITGVCTLQQGRSGCISFLANRQYQKYLADTQASAVILTPQDAEAAPVSGLIHTDPYLTYARVAELFSARPQPDSGIHETALIDPSVSLGDGVRVGARVIIEKGCEIGDGTIIHSGCVIGERVKIGRDCELLSNVTLNYEVSMGDRCRIQSGAVIGSDGFGYAPTGSGWHRVPQLGRVIMGNDVDIGANSTVDRGALDDTVLADGVILDNLVQIGHNVIIGEHSAIAAGCGIAGSSIIGKRCLLGGMVGVVGHIEVGDDVMLTGMSTVTGSIKKSGAYSSTQPAIPIKDWRRNAVRFRQLDALFGRVKKIEKDIK